MSKHPPPDDDRTVIDGSHTDIDPESDVPERIGAWRKFLARNALAVGAASTVALALSVGLVVAGFVEARSQRLGELVGEDFVRRIEAMEFLADAYDALGSPELAADMREEAKTLRAVGAE